MTDFQIRKNVSREECEALAAQHADDCDIAQWLRGYWDGMIDSPSAACTCGRAPAPTEATK